MVNCPFSDYDMFGQDGAVNYVWSWCTFSDFGGHANGVMHGRRHDDRLMCIFMPQNNFYLGRRSATYTDSIRNFIRFDSIHRNVCVCVYFCFPSLFKIIHTAPETKRVAF